MMDGKKFLVRINPTARSDDRINKRLFYSKALKASPSVGVPREEKIEGEIGLSITSLLNVKTQRTPLIHKPLPLGKTENRQTAISRPAPICSFSM